MQITVRDVIEIASFIFGFGMLYQKLLDMDVRLVRMESYIDARIKREGHK